MSRSSAISLALLPIVTLGLVGGLADTARGQTRIDRFDDLEVAARADTAATVRHAGTGGVERGGRARFLPLDGDMAQVAATDAGRPESAKSEYDAAYDALLAAPQDIDAAMRFVRAAKAEENHEAAIGVLEALLLRDATLDIVRAELGILYYRLDSHDLARQHLKQATASGKLPAGLQARAETLLTRAEKRTRRLTVDAAVTAGLRYQTNANAGPSGDQIRASGRDVALDDEFQAKDDFNAFLSAWGRARYDLGFQNEAKIDTTASLYASRQFEIEDNNVLSLTLGPGISFKPLPVSASWLEVRPNVYLNALLLADDVHALSYGLGGDVRARFESDLDILGAYQHRWRHYSNSDRRTQVERRGGGEHHMRLRARYPVLDNLGSTVGYAGIRTLTQRDFLDSWRHTIFARGDLRYRGPFELESAYWNAWLQVARDFKTFDSPQATLDPNLTREDRAWRVILGNRIEVVEDMYLNLQYNTELRRSNFSNFESDNHAGTLSFSYRY